VDEVVVVGVAVQPEASDTRRVDRPLRDAAGRDVDLDDAAAHGRGS
jgi:hypothetical protein